ncbi:hypothetical protein ABMA27_006976 [Loxostege sticticalis]|uniref:Uncharacterized protein n=1 Tax=Loxostege sticticalis TaxID=481309 RepID=A0ABR3IL63_LOXSC
MRCILMLFFLVCICYGKEQVIYKASGGVLFDLVRGFPPKEGALELTKVEEGSDPASLPDGIYFVPEDVSLDGVEPTKLYVSKNKDKDVESEKKPVSADGV